MPRSIVIVLQVLVAGAFAAGLFAQFVVIPATAAGEVALFPPYESVRVPLVTAAIVFIACFQVALVGVWALLHRAGKGAVFEHGALAWANVTIGALFAAAVVLAGLFVYVTFADIPSPSDGMEVIGLWLGSAVGTLAAIGAVLLLFVGRHLLSKAIVLRSEMDEVV
ncbi:DUF2975 domain-containing protein [Saccharopolyspora elongata]|uniref:DUF2975 domain-containing protein n=1 Tax=Saccharopolyspora elongata TaxID=2530387 RepID=A0A4R4YCM4_9PSEU|nr:DUF2975 domain-containing protein [Saccharopolyspora elongata]TDD42381.1 DUF2975 domain-containing protein [Saccharopolyspora elongata]